MATTLADLCIYTIKHSSELRDGRSGKFSEKRRWSTAQRLLADARRRGEHLAVVFSSAEETCEIVAWALLEGIDLTPEGTEYRFSDLQPVQGSRPLKTVLRKRNGQPLSEKFIRPYAICRTPAFLHSLVPVK